MHAAPRGQQISFVLSDVDVQTRRPSPPAHANSAPPPPTQQPHPLPSQPRNEAHELRARQRACSGALHAQPHAQQSYPYDGLAATSDYSEDAQSSFNAMPAVRVNAQVETENDARAQQHHHHHHNLLQQQAHPHHPNHPSHHHYNCTSSHATCAPTMLPMPSSVPIFTNPPALPKRRRISFGCSLACLATGGCLVFLTMLIVEAPWIALESSSQILNRRRAHEQQRWKQRQHPLSDSRDIASIVQIGLWDEHATISPLQLTVALSIAIGIDERNIIVTSEGAHFFRVRIAREGSWLLDAINSADSTFVPTINSQASSFGARLVVSHEATLLGNNRTV